MENFLDKHNMTPKEKSKELVYKMLDANATKQCAIIAVDEIINAFSEMKLIFSDRVIIGGYWKEVKNEIEKL